MKAAGAVIVAGLVLLGGFGSAPAADFKDKVKVEVLSVGLHPGMDPGMYVCAFGHLHIKATVENLAGRALGKIKVSGKAYDTDGKLIRRYVAEPRIIAAMATIEYFINLTDTSGGSGANFLIRWTAAQPVSQPVVEGVHAYFRGTQSLGFVTSGRVTATR